MIQGLSRGVIAISSNFIGGRKIDLISQVLFSGIKLAFLFKSMRAILSGLLTASGKTQFVMWNEAISIWLCFIMPIWICVQFFAFNVAWAYFIAFIYNLIAVVAYYLKFYNMNWEREGQVI